MDVKNAAEVPAAELLGQIGNFGVRLVRSGDRYGLEDRLLWEKKEPGVEFYFVDSRFSCSHKGRGRFIARYYYTTLRFRSPQAHGLCLDGGDPLRMSLTNMELARVMQMVDATVSEFASEETVQAWRDSWKLPD